MHLTQEITDVSLEAQKLGVFMEEKGIGVRGISTKVWDWLIQTLTERLHVSKKGHQSFVPVGLGLIFVHITTS